MVLFNNPQATFGIADDLFGDTPRIVSVEVAPGEFEQRAIGTPPSWSWSLA